MRAEDDVRVDEQRIGTLPLYLVEFSLQSIGGFHLGLLQGNPEAWGNLFGRLPCIRGCLGIMEDITRAAAGTASCRSSSRLGLSSVVMHVTPVKLCRPRARLATCSNGSPNRPKRCGLDGFGNDARGPGALS